MLFSGRAGWLRFHRASALNCHQGCKHIYAFTGASIQFIRQFEADYRAKPEFLTALLRKSGGGCELAFSVLIRRE
jgi:hypothetical protein